MKFAFAVHQLVMNKAAIDPGTVFPMNDEKVFDEQVGLGSIRPATTDEITLFKMTNVEFVKAEAAAAEAAAAKSKKKPSTTLVD